MDLPNDKAEKQLQRFRQMFTYENVATGFLKHVLIGVNSTEN
jgi:hypothetical protein